MESGTWKKRGARREQEHTGSYISVYKAFLSATKEYFKRFINPWPHRDGEGRVHREHPVVVEQNGASEAGGGLDLAGQAGRDFEVRSVRTGVVAPLEKSVPEAGVEPAREFPPSGF